MIFKCPKCHNPIVDGETAVLHFQVGGKHIYFCEPCGRGFKELKDIIEDKYNDDISELYQNYIREEL